MSTNYWADLCERAERSRRHRRIAKIAFAILVVGALAAFVARRAVADELSVSYGPTPLMAEARSPDIQADPGYFIPVASTKDCPFEVQSSGGPRTHDDYRKFPASPTDTATQGERLRIHGLLRMSSNGSDGLGVLTAPDTRLPGHLQMVVLAGVSNDQLAYLREHCEPNFPCSAFFLITNFGKIKTPTAIAKRPTDERCHMSDGGVSPPGLYIWNLGYGNVVSLDGWED
jgi:hypothetical protein